MSYLYTRHQRDDLSILQAGTKTYMAIRNLLRWSGILTILAGFLSIVLSIPALGLEGVLIHLVQGLLMLIGIVAVFYYQYPAIGSLGFAGFALAFIGSILLTSSTGNAEAFGFIAGGISSGLGFFLLGYATWRLKKFPQWIALAWILGAVIGIPAVLVVSIAGYLLLLSAVFFSAGFIGAGMVLWNDPFLKET